jgi:hypothetical protein
MSSASAGGLIGELVSAFAHEMRPVVGLLMVHTVLGAMLIPLLLTLLYFSTSRIRRTPLFWIVLFDVMVGLGVAIWDDVIMVSTRLPST